MWSRALRNELNCWILSWCPKNDINGCMYLKTLQTMDKQNVAYTYKGEATQMPTPVFLPREFHVQRSLERYSHGVAKSWT